MQNPVWMELAPTVLDQHWIWSEGCDGQFKNARIFQCLCSLHKNYKVPHMWNYFETGHGKGEHVSKHPYEERN